VKLRTNSVACHPFSICRRVPCFRDRRPRRRCDSMGHPAHAVGVFIPKIRPKSARTFAAACLSCVASRQTPPELLPSRPNHAALPRGRRLGRSRMDWRLIVERPLASVNSVFAANHAPVMSRVLALAWVAPGRSMGTPDCAQSFPNHVIRPPTWFSDKATVGSRFDRLKPGAGGPNEPRSDALAVSVGEDTIQGKPIGSCF
jgi:hypothetical protein